MGNGVLTVNFRKVAAGGPYIWVKSKSVEHLTSPATSCAYYRLPYSLDACTGIHMTIKPKMKEMLDPKNEVRRLIRETMQAVAFG